jgi:ADP-heptose:LPS heptosyltransferase
METDVLIRLSALGDVLLAIPTVRALENSGRRVFWLIGERLSALAPLLPGHVRCLSTRLTGSPSALLPTIRRLKSVHPRRILDLQGKPVTFAVSLLIGGKVSRYQKRPLPEQIAAGRGRYPVRGSDPRPVWQRYANTCGLSLDAPDGSLRQPPDLSGSEFSEIRAAGLTPGHYLVIHPEASHAPKRLPMEAVTAFCAESRRPVVLIGNGKSAPAPPGAIDLRNRTTLRELCAVLSGAAAVVSTDSGPMHLARALGRPLCAVFLQTDPGLGFPPLPGPEVRIISRALPCKPCSLHGQRTVCPEGHWRCRDLPWKEMARTIRDLDFPPTAEV